MTLQFRITILRTSVTIKKNFFSKISYAEKESRFLIQENSNLGIARTKIPF